MSLDFISDDLEKLKQSDMLRTLRTLSGPQGTHIRVNGKEYVSFCSNDYLGLPNSRELVEAAAEAMRRFGFGAGAARLVTGNMQPHADLERKIADFERAEDAIVFSTGYMANIGTIPALVGPGDLVIGDKLNHGSLIDGCRLSRAAFRFFGRRDVGDLEKRLAKADRFRRTLVVTDSVFSMDGDIAPLADIAEICRKHGAMLMVDEAHATGVFGEHGRGVAEQLGVEDQVHVRMGTLSKAVGGLGGFVAGSGELVDYLRNKARSFILTTAPPAAVCAAAAAGLEIVRNRPELRERLWKNVEGVVAALKGAGVPLQFGGTPIIPIILGEAAKALTVSRRLQDHGIMIPAIRPPAVPAGTSRLRLTVSAAHSEDEIAGLGRAFSEIGSDVIRSG